MTLNQNPTMRYCIASSRDFAPLASCLLILSFLLSSCVPIQVALPTRDSVTPTAPMPIDGLWRLDVNQKLYRIQKGHISIEEPLLITGIQYSPGQIVTQDLRQTSGSEFIGWDLALSGAWSAELGNDGLAVKVKSLFPFSGIMKPVEIDHQDWFNDQLASNNVIPLPRQLWPQGATENPVQQLQIPSQEILGDYHALIIGNANYENLTPLDTAINDAKAIAATLKNEYGFTTELLLDATRAETLTALRNYRENLAPSDNLLIYFAGHGWLDEAANEGYWLPVNASQSDEVEWISNSTITNYLRSIQAKHVMVIADSCYSGTLTRGIDLKVKSPGYLDKMAASRARIVLSSGGLEPVADSGANGHSAFAFAFLNALENNQSVIDSTTLYSEIRRPVMTMADQSPELADIRKAGHEGGDFLFVKRD